MVYPNVSAVEISILQALLDSGGSAKTKEVYPKVDESFLDPLSLGQRRNVIRSTGKKLINAGEIERSTPGVWKLTEIGRARLLGAQPDDEEDAPGFRTPKVRGRAPIFEHSQRSIASLISDIDEQLIALPDLQRPFVWTDTKVRDLLDSIFVGFPVGTLVLWHTSDGKKARVIGEDGDTLNSRSLVIDGQQRLTSLFAVLRGAKVSNKDGTKRHVTIAFRPRDGRFEVGDAAIPQDPEFLPNITELWQTRSKTQIKKDLLKRLREKGREVDDAYEDAVDENLDRARSISDYTFPVIAIRETATGAEVSDEDVAEIFVRINSQGVRLGQVDFVLTLLSVYHGELRDRIEQRAAALRADPVAALDTRQLLRATCAVAFGRARMQAIYRYLRGMDPVSGYTSVAARQGRLKKLDVAADECIDPTTWRDYTLRVMRAGFVEQDLIASNNAIVNAFAFYVLGRRNSVSKPVLDEFISRWVFTTLLSARYTGSSETAFEEDLRRVRDLDSADEGSFIRTLDNALSETTTGDYWGHIVVAALQTTRRQAPGALAFRAAQVVLGARGLFSDQLLQNLLAPTAKGKRSASEVHHLFPVAWLARAGITDRSIVNQVANYADLGYHENSTIGAQAPEEYVPRLRDELHLDDEHWGRMCAEHALPPGWESMDYNTFLAERRVRMAELIHVAFRKLGGESEAVPLPPPWFFPGADAVWRRIAETELRLRQIVREVYTAMFGEQAAEKIGERAENIVSALNEQEPDTLTRALRGRPPGADPLSVVDYFYLAQLPAVLLDPHTKEEANRRLGGGKAAKKLATAIEQIVPVRNEIAHMREVSQDRLQKAYVTCGEVLGMLEQAP